MKKLTQDVFSLSECPKDATIAVVCKDGRLAFGTFQDAKPSGDSWRGSEENNGKWYTIRLNGYGTSNWPEGCKIKKGETIMEKKIVLGSINHYGDDVMFKIAEQSSREDDFGDGKSYFKAKNGVTLKSSIFPQVMYNCGDLHLFVQGKITSTYNNVWICTSRKNFEKIQEAIKEYNEFFSGKIKLTEKDIRCIHKMEHKMSYTTEDGVDIKTVPDNYPSHQAKDNCNECILHGTDGCMVSDDRDYPWTYSRYEFHYEKA